MGTRLWYQMRDAAEDDDAAFERRLDGVVREIGERGKLLVASESGQEITEPTPAPAPAPTPPPALKPSLSTATAPVRSRTAQAPAPTSLPTPSAALVETASSLSLERDELLRQVQQVTSQLAALEANPAVVPTTGIASTNDSKMLSEAFFLELERAAERQAERERADRERERMDRAERADRERANEEARLVAALTAGTCTCGLGVVTFGAALLLTKQPM